MSYLVTRPTRTLSADITLSPPPPPDVCVRPHTPLQPHLDTAPLPQTSRAVTIPRNDHLSPWPLASQAGVFLPRTPPPPSPCSGYAPVLLRPAPTPGPTLPAAFQHCRQTPGESGPVRQSRARVRRDKDGDKGSQEPSARSRGAGVPEKRTVEKSRTLGGGCPWVGEKGRGRGGERLCRGEVQHDW